MRLSRTLIAGAALVAVASLTGCGGDGGGDVFGGPLDGKSLPKAKDIASMERFVNRYTVCKELETDATLGKHSEAAREFEGLPKGAQAGVKERAFCEADRGQPIALVAVSDMKKFLVASKASEDAGNDASALVGADFAVVPTDSDTSQALKSSGLLVASCNANFNSKIPSGYTKSENIVKGCVLTDYIPS
ncbi:hypothetical protein ACIPY6_38615 [Streptomyces sp. NPDC090054]|uniref:hypothetical protein n=1 Tax=Streptomyces sp. NPDC090054 TaxID=3365933 RepID=UPI003827832E